MKVKQFTTIFCACWLLATSAQAQTFIPTVLTTPQALTDQTVTVADASRIVANSNFYLLVDREAEQVLGVSGSVVTVIRNRGGLAAIHPVGAIVYPGPYNWFAQEDPLSSACGPRSSQVPYINLQTGMAWTCNTLGHWVNLNALPPGGTGPALASVLSTSLNVQSVADYGAVGNGVTDDSTAIVKAVAAAVAAGGGTVLLGPKSYSTGTTSIVVPATVNFIGSGFSSQLLYAGTGSAVRLTGSQFATIGYFGVITSNNAANAFEAGNETRQSLLVNFWAVGPNLGLNTGAGIYLNAGTGFSGGLKILNGNLTGFKFGVKFNSANTSTDTWTAVDITSLWASGRAAGVIAGSAGYYFDANTNGVGTKWRGGTIESFAVGIQHVNTGIGGDYEGDLEGNTLDYSVGSAFKGLIRNAITGAIAFNDGTSVLVQDSTQTMALRNGALSQSLLAYNTYTNPSNYQRVGLYGNWSNGPGVAVELLGTGTASNRSLNLVSGASGGVMIWDNAAQGWQFISDTLKPVTDGAKDIGDATHRVATGFYSKSVSTGHVAFASLPTAIEGMIIGVTDSNTAVWGATIAGGGANHVLAYYNGTNWTVAGK